tara:strand:+ start:121 stop:909 length:789 start_codon:yes stop_codon:yes gene_type:complete
MPLVHKYKLFFLKLFITLLASMIFSCSGNKEKEISYEERSLYIIYNSALIKLKNKDFEEAVYEFDEVERQHPYSVWARKSILMSSYASYKDRNFIKAEINLKRYISLYPASDLVPYAQYLLGMCYFDQIIDDKRDQTSVNNAYQTFSLILDRYPNTSYAKDAYYKIVFLENILAAKELSVGKTYLSLKKYIAAIKRFKYIVNNYQTTSYVPEALHRLVEIYLILGVNEEALLNARVLGHNFPDSKWYNYSYKLLKENKLLNK